MVMVDLSPRDLARALGVSESSVKRWVDDGAVMAMRTAGGHRRIALAEAVRFVRRTGAPLVRPDVIVGVGTGPVAAFDAAAAPQVGEQFFALLERDDAPAARALLLALYVSGWPVAAICDGPMRFALERIGTLWQHGPSGIVIEHRATDTCARTLAEIRALSTTPAADAPAALGAAPSGDRYILPSMMAATVLADLGYRDHNLGPDAPIAVLDEAAERYRPRIVWLAMSATPDDDRFAGSLGALAGRLERSGATLVLGGRGVPTLPPTSGLLHLHSMTELAAFARGVRAAGVVNAAGARPAH
jgi:excisionase family DNA binding protein